MPVIDPDRKTKVRSAKVASRARVMGSTKMRMIRSYLAGYVLSISSMLGGSPASIQATNGSGSPIA
jgi:hypothetical protein